MVFQAEEGSTSAQALEGFDVSLRLLLQCSAAWNDLHYTICTSELCMQRGHTLFGTTLRH